MCSIWVRKYSRKLCFEKAWNLTTRNKYPSDTVVSTYTCPHSSPYFCIYCTLTKHPHTLKWHHMVTVVSQIAGKLIIYSTACSPKIHIIGSLKGESKWWLVDSPHKGPVMQKMFPFYNIAMIKKMNQMNFHMAEGNCWIAIIEWDTCNLKNNLTGHTLALCHCYTSTEA